MMASRSANARYYNANREQIRTRQKRAVLERRKKTAFLKSLIKKEQITNVMLSEWTDIPYQKLSNGLNGYRMFPKSERKRIIDVFLGKYDEFILFGDVLEESEEES